MSNLDVDLINEISIKGNELTIYAKDKKASFIVTKVDAIAEDHEVRYCQQKVRWDWIYQDMINLSERPIVLNLGMNIATMITTYH